MATGNTTKSRTQPRTVSQDQRGGKLGPATESPLEQGVEYVRKCVNDHPETAALWCLGIGFVLGWKLKPW